MIVINDFHMTWGRDWTGPFEGAFTLLQKLAWANAMSADEICREVYSVPPKSGERSAGYRYRSLTYMDWQPPAVLHHFPEGFMSNVAPKWSHVLATDRCLRFCPSCLVHGYQTYLFQLLGLAQCPIHRRPLANCCCSCGAQTPPYAIEPAAFDTPFVCGSCGMPIAGRFKVEDLFRNQELYDAARQALSPIYVWLRRLEASRYSPLKLNRYDELRWMTQCESFGYEDDAKVAAFHLACCALPLSVPGDVLTPLPAAGRILHFQRDSASETPRRYQYRFLDDKPERSPCAQIYRSIRRYLQRRYLRRHRRCVREASILVHDTVGIDSAQVSSLCCPLAQAFTVWRLRTEPYVGVWLGDRDVAWQFRQKSFQQTLGYANFDVRIWGLIQLAGFYSIAAALTTYFGTLSRIDHEVQVEDNDGPRTKSEAFRRALPYLALDSPLLFNELRYLREPRNGASVRHNRPTTFAALLPSQQHAAALQKIAEPPAGGKRCCNFERLRRESERRLRIQKNWEASALKYQLELFETRRGLRRLP